MRKARAQNALLVLAHPFWRGNTLEDAIRWNFDGVEIYNHVCHWLNGKSNSLTHWDAMLKVNPDTLGFSADDAHLRPEYPGWNGGWIVVNASELSDQAILTAIRRGNYYSSCGPDFVSLTLDGKFLHVESTPVQFVRLVGPDHHGWRVGSFDGGLRTQVSAKIPADWDYVYVEIEDQRGKRAWSNTLFVSSRPA